VHIDLREIRPSRAWLVGASLLAVVLVLAGVASLVLGIVSAVRQLDIDQRFAAGQTIAVRMAPDAKTGIYARVPSAWDVNGDEESVPAPAADCTLTSPTGQALPLRTPSGTFITTVDDGVWYEVYVAAVPVAGDYRVTCTSDETARFAVGKHPEWGTFAGSLIAGIVAFIALPILGVATVVTTAIIVGRKRRDHRSRLVAEQVARIYQGTVVDP